MAIVNRTFFKLFTRGIHQNYMNLSSQKLKQQFMCLNGIRYYSSASQINWASTAHEHSEMVALWPDIIRDVTEIYQQDTPKLNERMAKVLHYNIPSGKKYSELILVHTYRALVPQDQLTEENMRLARILAWCVELHHNAYLAVDDLVDQATIRAGRLCWHTYTNLGPAAIKDIHLIDGSIFKLLRKYYKGKSCYEGLVETFHDMTFVTMCGQIQDTFSHSGERPNLEFFTMDHYKSFVKGKSDLPLYFMPFKLAMQLANVEDPVMYQEGKTILAELGFMFQVQDDYLDIYGDPKLTGKVFGTDIKDGKSSWPAITAIEHATPSQKKVFEECYGYGDEEKMARIKELYDEIGIPKMFEIYEDERYNVINNMIEQMNSESIRDVFFQILLKIYRRNSLL